MILASAVLGAVLGAIPFAWIVHRARTGDDLRRHGSGNPGAANLARRLGLGAGLVALVLDAGKGAAAVGVAQAAGGNGVVAGTAAVLAHVFSPWLGLRGGKGVATGLGVFAVLAPVAAAVAATVFVFVVLATRTVSLGSIAGAASLALLLLLGRAPREVRVAGVLIGALVIARHHANLARLARGTEPRLARTRAAPAPEHGPQESA